MDYNFHPVPLGFFDKEVESAYDLAVLEAKTLGHPQVESDHLLLGIIRQRNNLAADLLSKAGLGFAKLPALRQQVADPAIKRVSFNGHNPADTPASGEVLDLLELGKLKKDRENPAASEKRFAHVVHLLRAMLLTETKNPQMHRLLYAQRVGSHKDRPAIRLLKISAVDIDQLRSQAEDKSRSWF